MKVQRQPLTLLTWLVPSALLSLTNPSGGWPRTRLSMFYQAATVAHNEVVQPQSHHRTVTPLLGQHSFPLNPPESVMSQI